MGEYSDRVRADIVSDNASRKILYLVFAVIAGIAVFLLGGFAVFVAVLGLGPVLVLIVVVEIYCRIQTGGVFVRQKKLMPTSINSGQEPRFFQATSFISCGPERTKLRTRESRTSPETYGSPARR